MAYGRAYGRDPGMVEMGLHMGPTPRHGAPHDTTDTTWCHTDTTKPHPTAPLQVLPALCEPPAAGSGRCGDWRPRLSLARQLHAAMRAVAVPDAAGPEAAVTVARCAVQLCADPVWSVRQAAAGQVGLILGQALPPSPSEEEAAAGAVALCGDPAAVLTAPHRGWLERLPAVEGCEGLPGLGPEALQVLASWLAAAVGGTRAEESLAVTACCAAFAGRWP
jgi:hypothetical protein